MVRAGATCLCVEAGRTLLFDREGMVRAADAAGIAIVGSAVQEPAAQAS
jgi:UDP-2,3-diacylglucosamine hydrolase